MKNRKLIATIITAFMLFVCSVTAFAEDVTVSDTKPSTITEVTNASETDNTTQTDAEEQSTESDAESTTNEDNEGVTVIREEVTLEITESTETDIEINTSDVSLTRGDMLNSIVVDYENISTDIPKTGSATAIGLIVLTLAFICALVIMVNKKSE